jgi:uncharacterized protein YdcH (DUF465 family)
MAFSIAQQCPALRQILRGSCFRSIDTASTSVTIIARYTGESTLNTYPEQSTGVLTMLNEKHDLVHELPEHRDTIHQLKMNNNRFARLFDEYHNVNHEVHRIETDVETTSEDYLADKKKQRLHLKDELYSMIQKT